MGKLRLYIAASLDGFIADKDGGVSWLDRFNDLGEDFGYHSFLASIETVLMGRRTYEQILGFGDWPYAGKQAVVLSSQDVAAPPQGRVVEAGLTDLAEQLRAQEGDTWVVGGAQLIKGLLAAGGLDELMVFTMPVLLGEGVPLFDQVTAVGPERLELTGTGSYLGGVVHARYTVKRAVSG